MTRLLLPASCLLWIACAAPSSSPPLMEGAGDARGVQGLERLERTGAFVPGTVEQLRVHLDRAVVEGVSWTASAGALAVSGDELTWTLPDAASAELTARVVHRDGSEGTRSWVLSLLRSTPASAQEALLATPMPVLDGGTLEVSGGGCDLQYEGSTSNVAIAFTSQTHPSLTYGRWNGTAWTLEVVDALGFNTGGDIGTFVQMKVATDGTPHIVYLRNGQVFYATKSAGSWLRERVDSQTLQLYSGVPTLTLGTNGSPIVVYTSYSTYYRPVVATRSAPNTWSQTIALATGLTATSSYFLQGEAVLDGQARLLFPVHGNSLTWLVAWTGTSGTAIQFPTYLGSGFYAAGTLASPSRALWRGASTVLDVTLNNTTFTSSTVTESIVESSSSSNSGDIGWAVSRPVVLHQHGSSLELVTPNASGFWTYQQLGTSSGAVAGLAVQPTTGTASICYQASNRIMFQ